MDGSRLSALSSQWSRPASRALRAESRELRAVLSALRETVRPRALRAESRELRAVSYSFFAALASPFDDASSVSFSTSRPLSTPLAICFPASFWSLPYCFLSSLTFGAAALATAFLSSFTFGAAAFATFFTVFFTAFSPAATALFATFFACFLIFFAFRATCSSFNAVRVTLHRGRFGRRERAEDAVAALAQVAVLRDLFAIEPAAAALVAARRRRGDADAADAVDLDDVGDRVVRRQEVDVRHDEDLREVDVRRAGEDGGDDVAVQLHVGVDRLADLFRVTLALEHFRHRLTDAQDPLPRGHVDDRRVDRKSTRLNSSHGSIS